MIDVLYDFIIIIMRIDVTFFHNNFQYSKFPILKADFIINYRSYWSINS